MKPDEVIAAVGYCLFVGIMVYLGAVIHFSRTGDDRVGRFVPYGISSPRN